MRLPPGAVGHQGIQSVDNIIGVQSTRAVLVEVHDQGAIGVDAGLIHEMFPSSDMQERWFKPVPARTPASAGRSGAPAQLRHSPQRQSRNRWNVAVNEAAETETVDDLKATILTLVTRTIPMTGPWWLIRVGLTLIRIQAPTIVERPGDGGRSAWHPHPDRCSRYVESIPCRDPLSSRASCPVRS